eukprot:s1892_g5.t1
MAAPPAEAEAAHHKRRAQETDTVSELQPGSLVRLCDLKSAAELNGTSGTCLNFVSSGRWAVATEDGDKSLKPENLEPLHSGQKLFAAIAPAFYDTPNVEVQAKLGSWEDRGKHVGCSGDSSQSPSDHEAQFEAPLASPLIITKEALSGAMMQVASAFLNNSLHVTPVIMDADCSCVFESRRLEAPSGVAPSAVAEKMKTRNPKYVPREWMLVEAYDAASRGDYSITHNLYQLFRRPYDEQPESHEKYFRCTPPKYRGKGGVEIMT